jgi:hypothetical protein
MQKIVSALLFCFVCVNGISQTTNIETLRNDYYKVDTDSVACAKLYKKVKDQTFSDNTMQAYKGAITASMANHSKNKQEKIKLFNSGKKLLEESIKADSSNMELLFLRLTIQTSCPKALGYNSKIEKDKTFIINNIDKSKSALLKKRIIEFLLTSNRVNLTEAEKNKLKTIQTK